VRIREVQLLERPLQDHLFIEVVYTGHGVMGVDPNPGHQNSAQNDESSNS
jgi:hypothetical protein